MSIKDEIIFSSGGRIRDTLSLIGTEEFEQFEELRFRTGCPAFVKKSNGEFFINTNGSITKRPVNSFVPEKEDIDTFIRLLSGYSVYAFEEEIKNGFITVQGGHRIGITGRTVIKDGKINSLTDFSGINIRISHQIKGCGENILPYLFNGQEVLSAVIISPPGEGKTTLLRDLIRLLSLKGKNISVADERGEIAGSFNGIAGNDLGTHTDIMDGCPKNEGMLMLLRSMSPDIIAVDELGGYEEIRSVELILTSGVSFLCTVHGSDMQDAINRAGMEKSLCMAYFKRFIELKRTQSHINAVIRDENGRVIGNEAIR